MSFSNSTRDVVEVDVFEVEKCGQVMRSGDVHLVLVQAEEEAFHLIDCFKRVDLRKIQEITVPKADVFEEF